MKHRLLRHIFLMIFVFICVSVFCQSKEQEEKGFILFEPNLSNVLADENQAKTLDKLANEIKGLNLSNSQIIIKGYAAFAQNDIDPVKLSQDRAKFIINELEKRGVSRSFFSEPVGYGSINYWGDNSTEESQKPNRRVLVIIEKSPPPPPEKPEVIDEPAKSETTLDKLGGFGFGGRGNSLFLLILGLILFIIGLITGIIPLCIVGIILMLLGGLLGILFFILKVLFTIILILLIAGAVLLLLKSLGQINFSFPSIGLTGSSGPTSSTGSSRGTGTSSKQSTKKSYNAGGGGKKDEDEYDLPPEVLMWSNVPKRNGKWKKNLKSGKFEFFPNLDHKPDKFNYWIDNIPGEGRQRFTNKQLYEKAYNFIKNDKIIKKLPEYKALCKQYKKLWKGKAGIEFTKDGEVDWSKYSILPVNVKITGNRYKGPENNIDRINEAIAEKLGMTKQEFVAWKDNDQIWDNSGIKLSLAPEEGKNSTAALIPHAIHNNIIHIGGVSEAKSKENSAD